MPLESFSHYRVVEKIGEGGMGVVYRAHDERLERDVAIKVLPEERAIDEAARSQLLNEARAASALNHPNICTIYDVGLEGGRLYIAMEFCDGQPLKATIPSEGLPIESVVRIGLQIADGMAHAHDRRVVHRDLKTGNIMINREGRVKILDFGLAERVTRQTLDESTRSQTPTTSSVLPGTLPYMAPEVLRGELGDARSDLWAMGVVLYEMANGHLPFRGRTGFEVSSAILREPLPALPPRLPASLRTVILRCLAKEPGQRYQRAAEIRAALETLEPGRSPAHARRASKEKGSLAVLPFENSGADARMEYLSDGITETLINLLAQLPGLRVVARSTVFRYKGQSADLRQVGRELNVRAVVTGRVAQQEQSLVVAVELVDAASGFQLWGERYERKPEEILWVETEIAREISENLRLRLTRVEKKRLDKRQTTSTDAYHLYLKGRYWWNKRTEEGLRQAMSFFEQAIAQDPGYAVAHAGMADCYYLLAGTAYGSFSPAEAVPKAKATVHKALELDDQLAEAHASLATILMSEWEWAGAEREFHRAIALNPGYATAHQWYSFYLCALGRLDEALAEAQRAQELDPLSVIITRDVGLVFYYARRPDAAIEQYRKALELDPNFALARQAMGRAYLLKGMLAEAVAETERAVLLAQDNVAMQAALGHVYAVAGRVMEAQKILESLRDRSGRGYVSPVSIAVVCVGLGEIDSAFEYLEEAFRDRNGGLMTLMVHPVFEGLRSDPRYTDLLRRIGLPE